MLANGLLMTSNTAEINADSSINFPLCHLDHGLSFIPSVYFILEMSWDQALNWWGRDQGHCSSHCSPGVKMSPKYFFLASFVTEFPTHLLWFLSDYYFSGVREWCLTKGKGWNEDRKYRKAELRDRLGCAGLAVGDRGWQRSSLHSVRAWG